MNIGPVWNELLTDEFKKEYYLKLWQFLDDEYQKYTIYPDKDLIFNALKLTDYFDVSVCIIGQDPYYNPGQAHGLAFSVCSGVDLPQSLKNIFLELKDEFKIDIPKSGNLEYWAKQGVLLLNSVLTVRKKEPNSHKGYGWEIFTDNIISLLNAREKPVVFLLWGNDARKKEKLINNKKHLVLSTTHPSPLSAYRGFFGCGHFRKVNEFLKTNNEKEIDWDINHIN